MTVDASDAIGVAGFAAPVNGVAQLSPAAAWITAGILLLALALWPALRISSSKPRGQEFR